MRKLAIGLVAVGALVTATALPAAAQVGVYAGPGGIGVGVGPLAPASAQARTAARIVTAITITRGPVTEAPAGLMDTTECTTAIIIASLSAETKKERPARAFPFLFCFGAFDRTRD